LADGGDRDFPTGRFAMSGPYEQYFSNYYGHVASPAALDWNAVTALEHHGSRFPADKHAAILEIGPGFGTMLHCLRQRCGYQNLRAIDVSPEAVDLCNKIMPGSTELAADTAGYLEAHREEFDLILMLHVLEHVPKAEVLPLLTAIRGALRPGGKLVIEVPNIAHPIAGARNHYGDFTHTVGFTDQSLAFVLRNSGFADITIYGCKIPRKSLARLIQRTAQDGVELLLTLLLRLYGPSRPTILASLLGACATK
jgi:cyclopropane fatty-acyl-phospholipid synthase-like methyltransferase